MEKSKQKQNIVKVFYSWQSDLSDATNRGLIRECIKSASSKISNNETTLTIDEAARGMPGSPNIQLAIFSKINASHIFICDLTTINKDRPSDQRAVGNPNVLIELGYAISILGWERIIILFNKAFGEFPSDLPFDIDRHRCAPYEYQLNENNKANKEKLSETIRCAIKEILKHNPLRPTNVFKHAEIEKHRDVQLIETIMNTINTDIMYDIYEDAVSSNIPQDSFGLFAKLEKIILSSTFHFYDKKLKAKVLILYKAWQKLLSFAKYCKWSEVHERFRFYREPNKPFTEDQKKALEDFEQTARKYKRACEALIRYIRQEYIEIDLRSTNKTSLREQESLKDNINRSLEKKSITRVARRENSRTSGFLANLPEINLP